MVPGDGAFDHPPVCAQAGAVGLAALGQAWSDAFGPQHGEVLGMTVSTVTIQLIRSPPWPTTTALHSWDRVDQWFELGDIVAVAAGQ